MTYSSQVATSNASPDTGQRPEDLKSNKAKPCRSLPKIAIRKSKNQQTVQGS
jgi:hypothetical protein